MDRSQEAIPAARVSGIVITELVDGRLVYDLDSHHIHHLNQVSATVWRLCTGSRTVTDLAIASGLTEEVVRIALVKLANAHLLEGGMFVSGAAPGRTRRTLLKQGGAAMILPTVISITAPLAAQAASGSSRYYKCSNQGCDSQTACSNYCISANACPPGCVKTTQYTCMNFDGPFVPTMCAVYCDCS